ncbi:hypothetical protein ABT009_41965 [Streptomyces sp. NPDC002896]|uniref:hypothetical protein n=1 Tax=Streptomyces sp. NPDC002896 TaxID=3154438 RepID=UPI00331C49E7
MGSLSGVQESDRGSPRSPAPKLRDIGKRLVITTAAKKGQHPSPATVMRMLREHDEQAAMAVST